MKKRTYISPRIVRLEIEVVAQVMAGSQSPYAESKPNRPFIDEEDDEWPDDDGWE
ncbi:MAG: hypothetical protein LKE41_11065 [Prevotella sp.]|jgi:hypothetical protein|nr:hypothetical protein [Prevotella sp.]MCI2080670.1 hypothetical protein [Prevotella sp.]MCI2102560.1 hypothetical protein [Prevotella sp.]